MEPDEWSVPAIGGTEGQAGNPAAAPSSRLAMILVGQYSTFTEQSDNQMSLCAFRGRRLGLGSDESRVGHAQLNRD